MFAEIVGRDGNDDEGSDIDDNFEADDRESRLSEASREAKRAPDIA